MNYDLHIHTYHCGHAGTMTIGAILEAADGYDMQTICITDHIYSPDELNIPARIRQEVAKYKTNCRVLIGAEIDVDGQYDDGRLVSGVPDNLDYVIAGLHYIPAHGRYPRKIEDNPFSPEQLLQYFRKTILGIAKNSNVITHAHPCRMIATTIDFDIYFDQVLAIFTEAAQTYAQAGILWELNELDQYRIPEHYFDYWLKIYRTATDTGVRLVYGSDSHVPDFLGKSDFVERILSNLNGVQLQTPESLRLA